MKKIIYVLLLFLSVSLALSSCTEEPIKPKQYAAGDTSGGGTFDQVRK